MADAVGIQLADAVVSELNGHQFGQSFTASREYVPVYRLEDGDSIRVPVVVHSVTDTRTTRTSWAKRWVAQVGVLCKPATTTTEAFKRRLDDMVKLTEEIAHYLERHVPRPADLEDAYCLSVDIDPFCDWDFLEKHRQYAALITCTYRTDET